MGHESADAVAVGCEIGALCCSLICGLCAAAESSMSLNFLNFSEAYKAEEESPASRPEPVEEH